MKNKEFNSFLSESGRELFEQLLAHCTEKLKIMDVDNFELSMLANSFDLYATNAMICKDTGATQKPKEGGWDQVRPEYTIMKNEYQNILKHSSKFGLNPGDRAKFFKSLGDDKKGKKGFNLDGKMKVA